jgi:hypothetical protein
MQRQRICALLDTLEDVARLNTTEDRAPNTTWAGSIKLSSLSLGLMDLDARDKTDSATTVARLHKFVSDTCRSVHLELTML